jgi:hypothetical protein
MNPPRFQILQDPFDQRELAMMQSTMVFLNVCGAQSHWRSLSHPLLSDLRKGSPGRKANLYERYRDIRLQTLVCNAIRTEATGFVLGLRQTF